MKNLKLLLTIAFGVMSFGQLQAATLKFTADQTVLNIGQSTNIDIVISELGDMTSPSLSVYDITVGFDDAILSAGSIVFGNQLALVGGSYTETDDSTAGTINILELSFDTPATLDNMQADSFVLATISYTALAIGTTSLTFDSALLGDSLGDEILASLQDTSINVVPIPAAGWLFGSALAGLGWLRRKQTI